MILHVYSVYDHAVSAFMTPFFARARGEAMRSFSEACNNGEHQFAKHASDYTLFALGEWDDASGAFSALPAPTRVISALECLMVETPAVKRAEARERVAM